jgi:hypothetical protein
MLRSIFGSIILIDSSFRKLEWLSSPIMQYQGLLSVRRLIALHSGFLQTTPHDIALAFG